MQLFTLRHSLALLPLGFAAAVYAQAPFAFHAEALIVPDELVPGLVGGERFRSLASGPGSLSSDGRVCAMAQLYGLATIDGRDRVLVYGSSPADLKVLVHTGYQEPSGLLPGVLVETRTQYAISEQPLLADDGNAVFSAGFRQLGAVTNTNDSAIYIGTPGNLRILVREGDPVPGGGGTHFATDFAYATPLPIQMNSAQSIVLRTNLGGAGTWSANNEAILHGSESNLQMVLRRGQTGVHGVALTDLEDGVNLQMNAAGQFVHGVRLGAAAHLDAAVYLYTPGVGYEALLREGDPAPVLATTFGSTSGDWRIDSQSGSFNGRGELLAHIYLTGFVTFDQDDRGLFLLTRQGPRLIAQRRRQAPDTSAGQEFISFGQRLLSDDGRALFQAQLEGPGVTSANAYGLWYGAPGNVRLLARQGQVMPGLGGSAISDFGAMYLLEGGARVLFNAHLQGGTRGGSTLWSWTATRGFELLAISGEYIELRPGMTKQISTVQYSSIVQGDGRARGLAPNGNLLVWSSFLDGSNALLTSRLDSISAYPPRISAERGGMQRLRLDAGLTHAAQSYLVLGSLSGTSPGLALGALTLPLNPDGFLGLTIELANQHPFSASFGTLDAQGRARAAVSIPPGLPGAGVHFDWSYLALNGALQPVFVGAAAGLDLDL
ncbi:MAG: hypothetical protein IPN34_23915 [Planctomycetes bacterium]|nr:hypothetical protein [Planctomycetota bacterium]